MVLENLEKIKLINKDNLRSLHVGVLVEDPGPATPDQYNSSDVKLFVDTLSERGYQVTLLEFIEPIKIFERIKQEKIDIIFNLCEIVHGSSLFEPHIAATLEIMGVPFTGSNHATLETCLDKIKMKKILNFHGIPTAKWDYLESLGEEIDKTLEFPLIVKPAKQDGSIGINAKAVVANEKELYLQIEDIFKRFGGPILVEEFLTGDEYDVCILGNNCSEIRILPICKYYFKELPLGTYPFFPYEIKWQEHPVYNYGNVVCEQPVEKIDDKLREAINKNSLDAYRIFGCDGYGRVELRIDKNGDPAIIEVNPNPALDFDNNFVRLIELEGRNYGDLLEEVILSGVENFKYKNNL